MGKSPGKWIKNVFFGKKTTKSHFAKGKESTNEKEKLVRVRAPEPETETEVNLPDVSSGGFNAIDVDGCSLRSEVKEPSLDQSNEELPLSGDQYTEPQETRETVMLTDAEIIVQEKAATKAQAALRGYLARRAFKALKGIIRLQALIRGHLVRRQAVATLYCVVGIVKLQALVRGSRIRSSDTGLEVQKVCIVKPLDDKVGVHGDGVTAGISSLSLNAFTRKLLAPSPAVMPLRIQYDAADPNSVQQWLERWSISCPWKPVSPPKKLPGSKVQKRPGNSVTNDGETGRPKRSVRKVPSLFDTASGQSTSEGEKPRRNLKKVVSHSSDTVQENPQNELEKIKRSLRKVHNPTTESSGNGQLQTDVNERSTHSQAKIAPSNVQEVLVPKVTERSTHSQAKNTASNVQEVSVPKVTERSTHSQGKVTTYSAQEVSAPNEVNHVDTYEDTNNNVKEEAIVYPKTNEEVTIEEPLETNQSFDHLNGDDYMIKSESFENDEKDENIPVSNGVLKSKEDSILNENQKSGRRSSFQANQEHIEDDLQNTSKLPSYMQATESAKAKLRAQGSPRITTPDEAEKNNLTRRHSLPSAPNGKVNSASPRTQKPLQGSGGKSGNRSDKSLLSSRDGSGKAVQTQWRR